MADYELVDPKKDLEDSCRPKCAKPFHAYQFVMFILMEECTKRIQSDDTGSKHCTGQYFDYWQCLDHHVAPKLFEKLK